MNLVQFIGLICATILFVHGTLFTRVRNLYPIFLTCPMCVGFWVGIAGSCFFSRASFPSHVLDGCVVSVGALLTSLTIHLLDNS